MMIPVRWVFFVPAVLNAAVFVLLCPFLGDAMAPFDTPRVAFIAGVMVILAANTLACALVATDAAK